MRWFAFAAMLWLSATTWGQTRPVGLPDLVVSYHPDTGHRVEFAGVPLIRGTSIQIYKPDWKEGYYSSTNDQPKAEVSADGKTYVTHHVADKNKVKFEADETLRIVSADRMEYALTGKLDSDVEAHLEWGMGYLNAFAMYGGTYGANNKQSEMIVPEPDQNGDPTVIDDVDNIQLSTRFGKVTYKVEEGPGQLALLDGRKGAGRWWEQEQPTFWLGILGATVPKGQQFTIRVSITFEPKAAAAPAQAVTIAPEVHRVDNAVSRQAEPVVIIPKPKSVQWRKGQFALGAKTPVIVMNQSAVGAARVLSREVETRFGWKWKTMAADGVPGATKAIYFVEDTAQQNPEGYSIDVMPNAVIVRAAGRAGHFYAAQTLCQMFQVEGTDVLFPAGRIDDYPSLAFRGVHLFTGKDAMPLHRKLIERIFSRFKFNYLVLEADYTQWEADSKIWTNLSVPKEQMREYVKLAKENNLTPVPLVQSLGHSEWMFKNGRNKDLAEFPDKPYAYAVTNPKTYEFIEKVYEEALGLFDRPELFHIGHDEVTIFGNYPHRPEAKELGVTKLLLQDVNRLAEFFEPKNARMMMWGDMLLDRSESNDSSANAANPDEARARRDGLPKSVIICDWHYDDAAPEKYKSLEVFKKEGFTTIACPWFNPQNIYHISEAARMYGSLGTLQTTWAGYSVNDETLKKEFKQFSAYVLAAEYAWSDSSPAPKDLPYQPADVFLRELNRGREQTGTLKGTTFDLTAAKNLPAEDWLGFGTDAGFRSIRAPARLADVLFNENRDGLTLVALQGALMAQEPALPTSVTIEVRAKADEVAFLQTTAYPATPGETVGTYEVLYDDDTHETVPLIYGEGIRAWTDARETASAVVVVRGKTPNGLPVNLRMMRWKNPHPAKTIERVIFSTSHPYASPVLMGMTGVTR